MKKRFIKLNFYAFFFSLFMTTVVIGATDQYTYDNLNRLVQVQYDDGTAIQYAYDAVGNRLLQQVTAFSQLSLPTGAPFAPTGQGFEIPADAPTLQNFRAPGGK